ncbi:ATP-dependent helicase [Sedimenticola hydrogenitrophicus]|uniref:ATP-dependent helicase n=1 Tax=Sedimenticola hydrogenitrophicus TaxID=2967975 RepID=UPI0021A26791|nr:ATP-dependent helicase [Sedimenticola hydrogenitrophicus]
MAHLPPLTDEQLAVVHHGDGHARVSAVAGSGKTATLVARVLHLLDQGADPRRILALMFNASARRDFAERLQRAAAGHYPTLPDVRTFHALGLRITQSCERRGLLPSHRLVTQDWQAFDASRAALEQTLGTTRNRDREELLSKERVESFASFIGLVKADVVGPEELFDRMGLDPELAYFVAAYERFEAIRQKEGVRYYSDLIHEPVIALHRDPGIAAWLGDHMEHVILDEYQDINEAQQQLVKAVAGRRAQVMAVGDVDQCVYEWRGARPEFMVERFFRDFPGAVRYQLTRTFRFGHRLSLLADHAIAHNRGRDDHLCLSAAGTPDTRIERRAETAQPHPLPAILDDWRNGGRSLSEAAVLVRLYSMSVPLELALLRQGIPYRLEGHDSLFECPEIRSLLGHLRLAAGTLFDSDDSLATVETMLRVPQLGFRKAELARIAQALVKQPKYPDQLLRSLVNEEMSGYQRNRVLARAALWRQLQQRGKGAPAGELLRQVIEEAELYEFFRWSSPTPMQAQERQQTCESFLGFARESGRRAGSFLELIAELQARHRDGQGERLLITSIHRAKGLEWPLVILPGLVEGRFPYYLSPDQAGPVEDERRLFYVGCTRAQERLCLLHPPDPELDRYEQTQESQVPPPYRCVASRFLYEARTALSDRVGAALAGQAEQMTVAQAPALVNRYLQAVDAGFRVEERPKHPASKSAKGAKN